MNKLTLINNNEDKKIITFTIKLLINVIKNKMRVADYLKSGNYNAINGLNLLLPIKSK